MKTNIFIYASILAALIFMAGCNKEQPTDQKNTIQVSAQSKNIGALLTSFKVRMNSQLKTTDSIPADSVEWYLGATINYTYGDATAKGPNQLIDSCFVSLQISGSYVQFDDFRDLYNSILDSIREPFYSINDNDKHLLATMVTTTRITSSQINYKITSIFQSGNFGGATIQFGPNEYWKWWNGGTNNGGYCDGLYQGTHLESDAAIEIQQKMFYRKGVPSGYFCFIPPFETVWIFAEDYPNPNYSGPENYYKYYMFWNSNLYSQFHDCLNPTEMNFYLTGTEHVIYTSREASTDPGARPPLLSLITLELSGDAYFPAYNVSVYLHDGYAHYGLLVQSGGNPDNL
jgi:hypothetical protein